MSGASLPAARMRRPPDDHRPPGPISRDSDQRTHSERQLPGGLISLRPRRKRKCASAISPTRALRPGSPRSPMSRPPSRGGCHARPSRHRVPRRREHAGPVGAGAGGGARGSQRQARHGVLAHRRSRGDPLHRRRLPGIGLVRFSVLCPIGEPRSPTPLPEGGRPPWGRFAAVVGVHGRSVAPVPAPRVGQRRRREGRAAPWNAGTDEPPKGSPPSAARNHPARRLWRVPCTRGRSTGRREWPSAEVAPTTAGPFTSKTSAAPTGSGRQGRVDSGRQATVESQSPR